MTVHIGRYLPSLTEGCCSNKVYALVFNQDNEAMKEITSSPLLWQIASYVKTSHADFCIVLGEHSQRTKYYYFEFEDEEFDLEETPAGQTYWIEIWERTATDTSYSRSEDTLHEAVPVTWDGTKFVESRIGSSQVDELSEWVAHIAASYEPSSQELRLAAWLEKNGALQSGAQKVNIELFKLDGTQVLDEEVTTQAVSGFFMWDSPGLDLDPDTVYALKAKIRSSGGIDYETGQAIVTWN